MKTYPLCFKCPQPNPWTSKWRIADDWWDWCLSNLERPAKVYFYNSNNGDRTCERVAHIFRRRNNSLDAQKYSTSYSVAVGETWWFYMMSFNSSVDRDLFILAFSGDITVVRAVDLPFRINAPELE